MIERRPEITDYIGTLLELNRIEKEITEKYDAPKSDDEAKLDAVNFARLSLSHAKHLKSASNPIDLEFCQTQIPRWTTAITPLKQNDWEALKKEILNESEILKETLPDELAQSEAFRNLANSLP